MLAGKPLFKKTVNNNKMEHNNFIFKQESIKQVFKDNAVPSDKDFTGRDRFSSGNHLISLMDDKVYFKQDSIFSEGDYVLFDITDHTGDHRIKITFTYTYKVGAYDDMLLELSLLNISTNSVTWIQK